MTLSDSPARDNDREDAYRSVHDLENDLAAIRIRAGLLVDMAKTEGDRTACASADIGRERVGQHVLGFLLGHAVLGEVLDIAIGTTGPDHLKMRHAPAPMLSPMITFIGKLSI